MKRAKIIYQDGVVERLVFEDADKARAYADGEARRRGTRVRAISCEDCDLPESYLYREGSVV